MDQRLFVFGLGYCATYLAEKCLAAGWQVSGTVRSADKARHLQRQGIAAHVFTGDVFTGDVFAGDTPDQALLDDLAAAPYVLQSVGLINGQDPILPSFQEQIIARTRRWVGYLSTTVVYGDHGGAWVDETMPPSPTTARGRARLAAEAQWAALPLPLHIFRLAGIYGPGRNLLNKILAGKTETIIKPGQVFSRIHVADIAELLYASMQAPVALSGQAEIYNGADSESAPPQDVAAYAAKLLGCPPPPQVPYDQATLSPMARSFYADNKRVANAKMRTLLGGDLRYPSYREGLTALHASMT